MADFGIAKWADGTVRTQAGVVLGTPAYMAPEVVGDGPTFRSDLYSLGILLFELLTGSVPFRSPDALAVLRSHPEVHQPGALPSASTPGVSGSLMAFLPCVEVQSVVRP
ncbi:MAG: protein kinase [Candidatus Riflebacteria bacterium]|nr:protein kinase [Candidatus Riflebacteria bacterium]